MTDPADLQAVRAYFALHKDALIQQAGAHGAGVGRSQRNPNAYAIVMYVKAAPTGQPPAPVVDGIPIEFVITDGFMPLSP